MLQVMACLPFRRDFAAKGIFRLHQTYLMIPRRQTRQGCFSRKSRKIPVKPEVSRDYLSKVIT
jgi:hypothetical protein